MSESDSMFHILFKIWCFILGLALLATGIFYIVCGGKLVSLGGSWYFLISGLFITISAISIFRKKALGVWIFAAVFVGTVIWSLIDAGWEFWPL
ncbi:membrane-bound PQQ-dependent dehydrogenase, glucose/quinate/shikimate family, partial [Acinetobacter baumannii]